MGVNNTHAEVNLEIKNKKTKCDVCDRYLETTNKMEEHIVKVRIKVICDYCSENFSTIKHLESHKRKKHTNTGSEPVQDIPTCDLCGIMVHSDQQITEHITLHGGNKSTTEADGPYQCSECAKLLSSIDATEEHIRMTRVNLFQQTFFLTNIMQGM